VSGEGGTPCHLSGPIQTTLQVYHMKLACALLEKNFSPSPVKQKPPRVTSLNIKKDIGK